MKLRDQSEQYARLFSRLIRLYPPRHQREYGPAMLQLLRDQLADAEQLNDQHILKETFFYALLGLPGSWVKEYLSVGRTDIKQLFDLRRPSWTVMSVWFFIATALYLIFLWRSTSVVSQTVGLALELLAALLPIVFTFSVTRRLVLSFWVLATGLIVVGIDNIIMAGIQARAMGSPDSTIVAWSVASSVLPLLAMYALTSVFYLFPTRFRRPDLASMSPAELNAYQQQTQRRRARNKRLTLAFITAFIGLNLLGLYDPAVSQADLSLPSRVVAPEDNMHTELERLNQETTLTGVEETEVQRLISGETWNDERARDLLDRSGQLRSTLILASAKPAFQDPSLADLSSYQTAQAAAAAPIMRLNGVRQASLLTLLEAEQLSRSGQVDQAARRVQTVLIVGRKISSSQGALITHLVGTAIEGEGLAVLKRLAAKGLSEAVREI